MDIKTTPLHPALAAYGAADRLKAAAPDSEPLPSFGALLQETLQEAVGAGRRSEAVTAQAVAGQAPLQEVVEAVHAAEVTLQTAVAVRDRVIAAYQDIIRMPI